MSCYDVYRILIDEFAETVRGVSVSDGEITVAPYRDDLLNLIIEKNLDSDIDTNAILYNEKVAEALKRPGSQMRVSLDCGTPETFQRIKRVDKFNDVVQNIERYKKAGARVCLKYILLPGYNDSIEEVKAFIQIALRLQPFLITLSNDMYMGEKNPVGSLSDSQFELLEYFVNSAKENGFKVKYMSHCFMPADHAGLNRLCYN